MPPPLPLKRSSAAWSFGFRSGWYFSASLRLGALQLLLADVPRDAEDLVVVALAHALATLTMAARSSSSWNRYPRRNSSMTSPSSWPSLAWYATASCRFGSNRAAAVSDPRHAALAENLQQLPVNELDA